MLLAEETDLVHRDAGLPGLATVLNPEAFIEALQRAAPDIDARGARLTRLTYVPRQHCHAAYRIDVGETELDVGALAARPADLAAWRESEAPDRPRPRGRQRIVLEHCAVVLHVFPHDPMLPQLRHLTDPGERERLLREALPGRSDLWQGELRSLRYKPTRHYVAELLSANGAPAILKCYPEQPYARCKHNAAAFHSGGPLAIATPLACIDAHRLIAFERLPGRPLTSLYRETELDREAVSATGAALATLHAQVPDGLRRWSHSEEVKALVSVCAALGFICPRLASRAGELTARLATLLNDTGVRRPVHGDFSANQVLVNGPESVAIIDLDAARHGDAADDLGNVIAQAERMALRGELTPGRAEEIREVLLDGYARASRHPLPEQIALWTALQLFRCTRYPFRTREPDWPQRTEALLERVETMLDAAAYDYGKRGSGGRNRNEARQHDAPNRTSTHGGQVSERESWN